VLQSFLKQRVTLERLERDPIGGGFLVVATVQNVPAFIAGGGTREAGGLDERFQDVAAVYLGPTAPIVSSRETWRVIDGDRQLEVRTIEPVRNPLNGALHHYRLTTTVGRFA